MKKIMHFSGQTLPLKWLIGLAYIEELKKCIFFPKQKNLFIFKTSEVASANTNTFLNPTEDTQRNTPISTFLFH